MAIFYGTQFGGGTYNEGTVFRISRSGAGFKVLYNFKGVNQPGNSTDGAQPEGRLVQIADGTIYGTTSFGGTPGGYGTAWSLKLIAGKWVYKQIRRFDCDEHDPRGREPSAQRPGAVRRRPLRDGRRRRAFPERRDLQADAAEDRRRRVGLSDAPQLRRPQQQWRDAFWRT